MKIKINVHPRSKKDAVIQASTDNFYTVHTKEPPIKGRANEAVLKLIAKHFNVSRSKVKIVMGKKNKDKIIEIEEKLLIP